MKRFISVLGLISGLHAVPLDKTTIGRIKKLKIVSIMNLGLLQDDYECLSDKNDEIVLEYESGGQTQEVHSSVFASYSKFEINKEFIC
jgi:hypothetical protein